MNTVLGAAVAAFSTDKGILSTAAIGLSTGGTLFFGGPKVEDLSHQLADACFSKDTSLHTVAKKVASVTLVAFATFAVVNLGASALAFSWTAPLSFLGAAVSSATYHILSQAAESSSSVEEMTDYIKQMTDYVNQKTDYIKQKTDYIKQKVDVSELKGACIGQLSKGGKGFTITNSQGCALNLVLFDPSGDFLREAIPTDQKARMYRALGNCSGFKSVGTVSMADVIIENGFVYSKRKERSLDYKIGGINEEGQAVVHVCDEGFMSFDLINCSGELLTEPMILCREFPLKICGLDGRLHDVVLLAGELYQESGKPFYFGKKLGMVNEDGVSATLEDGSVCQVRNMALNVVKTLSMKDIISPLTLIKDEETIEVYYLNGELYERLKDNRFTLVHQK